MIPIEFGAPPVSVSGKCSKIHVSKLCFQNTWINLVAPKKYSLKEFVSVPMKLFHVRLAFLTFIILIRGEWVGAGGVFGDVRSTYRVLVVSVRTEGVRLQGKSKSRAYF